MRSKSLFLFLLCCYLGISAQNEISVFFSKKGEVYIPEMKLYWLIGHDTMELPAENNKCIISDEQINEMYKLKAGFFSLLIESRGHYYSLNFKGFLKAEEKIELEVTIYTRRRKRYLYSIRQSCFVYTPVLKTHFPGYRSLFKAVRKGG